MAKVNSILDQRMKKPANVSKMEAMAKQSASGQLTSFSGLFSISDLSEREKEQLAELLRNYSTEDREIEQDLHQLISLTSEVKAINNQAALLHGERIKKVHTILTHYRDGAFTAWMIAAYGNRQTPYNLMQYWEFCEAMPKHLRQNIEWMPRQAVYVLASREGSLEKKEEIVKNYHGQTKSEMLALIRDHFPLGDGDKRQEKIHVGFILGLQKLYQQLLRSRKKFSALQKEEALNLLSKIEYYVKNS